MIDHARAQTTQRMRAALAHIAVSANHANLARDHHVGGALDSIGQRFAAAVKVIELRLGNRIVDVDRRNQQRARFVHLVQAMDAGGRLFGNAAPVFDHVVPAGLVLAVNLLQEILDDLLFFVAGGAVDPVAAVFELIAFVDKQRGVAAIVDDQLGSEAARMAERLIGAPPVFLERFALPRKDRNAGRRNGRRGVILRREDVAARPANAGAEVDQRLNQNRGLDGHVKRAGDANPRQWLRFRVFPPDRHQAGHFLLGDHNFFAAPFGQFHVGDFVVGTDFGLSVTLLCS